MQMINFLPNTIKTADNQPGRKYVSPTINTNNVWMSLKSKPSGVPHFKVFSRGVSLSFFPTLFLECCKTCEDPRCIVRLWVCNHISGPQLQLCPNPQEQVGIRHQSLCEEGTNVNYSSSSDSHWNFKTLEPQLNWRSPRRHETNIIFRDRQEVFYKTSLLSWLFVWAVLSGWDKMNICLSESS